MKKEMIKFINGLEGPKAYVILTDEGFIQDSELNEFLAMLTMIMKEHKDEISKETFHKAVDSAYKIDTPEFDKDLDKLIKRTEKLIELIKGLDNE
jgi:hypothetical protein